MINLTYLYYKLKLQSLIKYHNITEHNAGLMFEWEQEVEKAESLGGNYPKKPFIEPFEFKDDDYLVIEKKLRVRPEDILLAKENEDDKVEITVGEEIFVLKETIEEFDKLLQ